MRKHLLMLGLIAILSTSLFVFAATGDNLTGDTLTGADLGSGTVTQTNSEYPKIVIDPETNRIMVIPFEGAVPIMSTTISTDEDETTEGTTGTGTLVETGTNLTGTTNTGTIDLGTGSAETNIGTGNDNILIDTGDIAPTTSLDPLISTGTEFEIALSRMHVNGLTKYDNEEDYRPEDLLTREEAAKIFGQAYIALGLPNEIKSADCDFDDDKLFDPTLVEHISNVCKLGLFQGSEGNYMPLQSLTKAQATAVLIRMLEGKISNEDKVPWWADYYQKAFSVGITVVDNINIYNYELPRREITLMIYRFRQIIESEELKQKALNKASQINEDSVYINTGENLGGTNTGYLQSLFNSGTILSDPELVEAIHRMHDNGITSTDNVSDFRVFDVLTRSEAAKILDKFSNFFAMEGVQNEYLPNECSFDDIQDLNSDLQLNIQNVCKKGLMGGEGLKFNPDQEVLYAEFITALVRMLNMGKHLDETIDPWRTNYYEQAVEVGLIESSDIANFEYLISRYHASLLIYKFFNKNIIANSMNSNINTNLLMRTVEGTWSDDNIDGAKIYFDSNLFEDGSLEISNIEILDINYKIVKTLKKDYLAESFVWYADIFEIVDDQKVGTISLTYSNGVLVQGTIRIDTDNYLIRINDEGGYYDLVVI